MHQVSQVKLVLIDTFANCDKKSLEEVGEGHGIGDFLKKIYVFFKCNNLGWSYSEMFHIKKSIQCSPDILNESLS